MICRFVFCLISISVSCEIFAQPDWKVDPAMFEYNMAITGVGIVPCVETQDANDMVAAFVGDQVRGVKFFDGLSNGRNYCYMLVYDSVFTGSKVTFKMYDASEDTIYDAIETLNFQENGNHGSDANPFVFRVEPKLDKILISTDSISIYSPIGPALAQFELKNINGDTIDAQFIFINDSIGKDNYLFKIENNNLILTKAITGLATGDLMIHVQAKSLLGCLLDTVLILHLSNKIVANVNLNSEGVILMFPNPSSGFVSVNSEANIKSYGVYNLVGEKIVEDTFKGYIDLSSTNIIAGNYLVLFFGENKKLLGKEMLMVNRY